jgi:hypothetical protein
MTFIPESIRVANETFSPVSAGIVALVTAIVITGLWEFLTRVRHLNDKKKADHWRAV